MKGKLLLIFLMLLCFSPIMVVSAADSSTAGEVKPLQAGLATDEKPAEEAIMANTPQEATQEKASAETTKNNSTYKIGIDDVLDIEIIQPEQRSTTVVVAPDGTISVPYVGNVKVVHMSLSEAEALITSKLADGYLKYPIVSIALKENRSKKFFVYGEVMKPGTYILDENTTVLEAISLAGGFTKYGSTSRVKILRPKKVSADYETIKINLDAVMNGNSKADIILKPGDTVVVSEGIF